MIYGIIFFAVLLFDLITKTIVDANDTQMVIIDGIFGFHNTRNPGAALGMLGEKSWAMTFFIVITIVALIAVAIFLIFQKTDSKWLNLSLVFISSGAVGNFIDRLALKEVRDFIYMYFFNCNIADVAITVGGIMLVFYFLFLDEDAIFKKKEKSND